MQNTILSSVSNLSNDANPSAWARKASVGSEGTVVGWAGTLLLLCVGIFLNLFSQLLICCCVVFSACVQH